MRYFLLAFTLLMNFAAVSQTDFKELIVQLNQETDVEKKTSLFIDVAWEYMLQENDSSLVYARQAYDYATANNYAFGQVISLEMQGLYYESVVNEFEKAIETYLEAIAIAKQKEVDYLDSLHLAIGVLFQQTDNYEKAREYYEMALNEARKSNHYAVIKIALINLGVIYNRMELFTKAESYLKESLAMGLEDTEADDATYNNLGRVLMKQGKYQEAMPYLLLSVANPNAKSDPRYGLHYASLAENMLNLNQTEGIDSLIPILEEYKQLIVSQNERTPVVGSLAALYEAKGDYLLALSNTKNLIEIQDSIALADRNTLIYDLETKYQTQQAKQALEKKEQQQLLYLILAGSGFLIALLLGFFFIKNRKKNALLARQKKMLEATIDEKNILLKETHHRVKNSFQIVSSLLYLQSENMTDKEGQLAIQEAQNRVRSMILMHQKLYNKDRLVGIETQDYFKDLVGDIMESNQDPNKPIETSLDICSKVLDIDTITPLGLIVNELITNVLKHAWPDNNDHKQIHISLVEKNNALLLSVQDNGKGMTSPVKAGSFGVMLIKALAKKLDATLDYLSAKPKGTRAVLEIRKYG